MSDTSKASFDEPVDLKSGHVLFAEGERAHYLYLVVKGEVRIVREGDSRLIPIDVVKKGEFIGELSMFSPDESRSDCAVAVEDSSVLVFKKSDIQKVIRTCPPWVSTMMETLSERLKASLDVLREHKITDVAIMGEGYDLDPKTEKKLQKSIADYKKRKGLK